MVYEGRFYDGLTSKVHHVEVVLVGTPQDGTWLLRHEDSHDVLASWPAASLLSLPSISGVQSITSSTANTAARLVLDGLNDPALIHTLMPALAVHEKREKRAHFKLLGGATAIVAVLMGFYLWGIPVFATQITAALPPAWEQEIGQAVAAQFEEAFVDDYGFEPCDTNPESEANRAISGLVDRIMAGRETPFSVKVSVIKTTLPNAFALPGGQVYYLSAFLDETKTADEFAGVLAHEIGHVVHRHGMQQLVSSAGTGLLVGFLLGDMTGFSLAGGLGSTLLDSRNSREAEREADSFATTVAEQVHFKASALIDVLERVAKDNDFSKALALLSSHPLTSERKQAMIDHTQLFPENAQSPLSESEWHAIQTMCDTAK